uniref:thioredoxin-dependent peroxiredoxin n=1 Tax=Ditylenchus dipsaci TaxID=166011 RepID=A0A915ED30_9BILA
MQSLKVPVFRPLSNFGSNEGDDIIQAICKRSHASIGKPAPKFVTDAVVDGQFKRVSLSDYEGQYVVLFFYPLDFTFKLNVSVLAVSTDSKFAHLEWINKPRNSGGLGQLNYPLLADTNHSISRSYGVLKHEDGIAYRGLFIIDPSGLVRQITINDLPVGRSVDETLRLVQAIQYVEKNGEVCPADWMPGREAINPSNSNKYFSKMLTALFAPKIRFRHEIRIPKISANLINKDRSHRC